MTSTTYNQSGYTYNEQYANYHGFRSIDNCTTYNQAGLTYNEVGYPYHGICSITILPNSAEIQLSLPQSSVVFGVLFEASVLNITTSVVPPSISVIQNATISPQVLSVVLSLPDETVYVDQLVEVSVQNITVSLNNTSVEAIRSVSISPSVFELITSINSPDVEAIESLNISIVPRMVIAERKPKAITQSMVLKSVVSQVKMKSQSESTNAQLENQSLTYNEDGYTYNDARANYGGIYGEQHVIRPSNIITEVKPLFS